jgi:hypothetical protein
MHLHGKRWIYDIGGRRLSVENAWSWTLWAQERVVLDGVCVCAAGGYMTTDRSFTLQVSETGFSAPLHVILYSGLWGIKVIVTLGDQRLTPVDVRRGGWRDHKGGWPSATAEAQARPQA